MGCRECEQGYEMSIHLRAPLPSLMANGCRPNSSTGQGQEDHVRQAGLASVVNKNWAFEGLILSLAAETLQSGYALLTSCYVISISYILKIFSSLPFPAIRFTAMASFLFPS